MKSKLSLLVVLAVVAGVAVFTGCSSGPKIAAMYHQNWGTFGEAARIPVKDFESLGLVFTKVTFAINDKAVITGDVFTYQALLKEAELKNADAIINVTIDRRTENIMVGGGLGAKTIRQETWYGSALAIRYTEAMPQTNQDILVTNEPRVYTWQDMKSQDRVQFTITGDAHPSY